MHNATFAVACILKRLSQIQKIQGIIHYEIEFVVIIDVLYLLHAILCYADHAAKSSEA